MIGQLNLGFSLFASLLLEATPFLIIGILISSLLLVVVDVGKLVASFPSNPILGILFGSFLGLFLPVCQYGNVPVARRLLLLGIPAPMAMSFLVAAPTINPLSIWLTWRAFPGQPEILFWQILGALTMAAIVGCIFNTRISKQSRQALPQKRLDWQKRFSFLRSGSFLLSETERALVYPLNRTGKLLYGYKPRSTSERGFKLQLVQFLQNTTEELLEFGGVLAIGCAIAAVCQMIFPFSAIDSQTRASVPGIFSTLVWSQVLSVGVTTKILLVAKTSSHFTLAAIVGFLLSGSIIDLKGIGLLLATFRVRVTIYLSILIWQLTFLFTLLLDFYVF